MVAAATSHDIFVYRVLNWNTSSFSLYQTSQDRAAAIFRVRTNKGSSLPTAKTFIK